MNFGEETIVNKQMAVFNFIYKKENLKTGIMKLN